MVTVVFPTPPRRLDTAMKVVTEGFPKIILSTGSPLPNRRLCLKPVPLQLRAASSGWTKHLVRHHRRAARSRPHNHPIENNGKTTALFQVRIAGSDITAIVQHGSPPCANASHAPAKECMTSTVCQIFVPQCLLALSGQRIACKFWGRRG